MAEGSKEPRNLIKREDVAITLRNDKGPDAKLDSFKVEDFTKKGDNYACVVTSIIVEYTQNGKPNQTSYVVKLNPCHGEGMLATLMNPIFKRETGFYQTLLPELNKKLKKSQEPPLKVAKHYHSVETDNQQVIFLEDLRTSGYKMHDRMVTMDKAHCELIIKELARLHAASYLLFKGIEDDTSVYKRYPFAKPNDDVVNKASEAMWTPMLEGLAALTDQIPNYEYLSEYFRGRKETLTDDFTGLREAKRPFFVLLHGDCWNNNFLFRYSSVGVPLECRLVDLQLVRVGSPAMDLNYVLYCSVAGKTRRDHLPNFLTNYYANFASVLAGTGVPLEFSLSQFKTEFHNKNLFGLMMAVIIVPAMLLKPEEAPNMKDFFEGDTVKALEAFRKKLNELTLKSPSLRPRLLDMFDEMQEYGMFKKSSVSKLIRSFSKD